MPTIEERLQAIEREHTELKKTVELQTIAIGALAREQQTEEDGKTIGPETEMRQRFTNVETILAQILARLPEKP